MYTFKSNPIKIFEKNEAISYLRFLELISSNESFRFRFNNFLASSKFNAIYWECRPVNIESAQLPFEFVIIEAKSLSRVKPELRAFKKHFNHDSAVSFFNLGKDAELIVPCPIKDDLNVYTHIGNFVRQAEEHQISDFWQLVGEIMKSALCKENKWLSTAGLGVYWLHVRIDSSPKYYKYQSYKLKHQDS